MKRDRLGTAAGQTLVEAALVIPMMLAAFLCVLQILLLAHARVMLQYAAFNAARAGIVQNGSRDAMRAAATISMLPVYCKTDSLNDMVNPTVPGNCLKVLPTLIGGQLLDTLTRNLEDYATNALGVNATLSLPQVALVDVSATNPLLSDFKDPQGNAIDEIDFDLPSRVCPKGNTCPEVDADALRKTRLTLYVSALVPMQIPVGGRLVFYYWLIMRYVAGGTLPNDPLNWIAAQNAQHQTLEQIASSVAFATTLSLSNPRAFLRDQLTYEVIRLLALNASVYMFPIETSYSMPMESNFYKDNL